jgi:hypothetical protein
VTIPNIFHKTYDENFISDFLAHILHPINSGLGFAPLQSLLNFANVSIPLDFHDGVGSKVIREFPLSDESRIDILIIMKKAMVVVAIENKVFSSEGHKQTIRYAEAIQERFPTYTQVLLYLTPIGMTPSSQEFLPLSYAQLLSALRSIKPLDVPDKDQFIYQDFLFHVENYIMKSINLKLSEKSLLYIKNSEMIEDIQEAFAQDASTVFEVWSEIVKGAFESVSDDWDFSIVEDRGHQQAWKNNWRTNQLWIHYEFWLSKNSLFTEPQFSFMLEVEGKEKDLFLHRFDSLQDKLKANFQNTSLQYRPRSRRRAIAYKDYMFQLLPNNLDRSGIESVFQKAIDELLFLIEPVDQTLVTYKS